MIYNIFVHKIKVELRWLKAQKTIAWFEGTEVRRTRTIGSIFPEMDFKNNTGLTTISTLLSHGAHEWIAMANFTRTNQQFCQRENFAR